MIDSEFRSLVSGILETAKDFDTRHSNNPPMEKRHLLLKVLSREVNQILAERGYDPDVLQVQPGGRMSNYSPVCWLRIFDPAHSPSAQNGFYVVLLFAADGSSAYLSLNQGTSEYRSGQMRPINRDEAILNRAFAARNALSDWNPDLFHEPQIDVELAADSLAVGQDSKRRARNYELGNIYSRQYQAATIPSVETFVNDLEELLLLLWALEGVSLDVVSDFVAEGSKKTAGQKKKVLGSGQGRQTDPLIRRKIELAAEDKAESYYQDLGWTVERVGPQKLGYDLRCKRGSEELHVEVKGTTGIGTTVILTRNEVDHCREYEAMALFVLTEIKIDDAGDVIDGGKPNLLDPWQLDDSRLDPREYSYRI